MRRHLALVLTALMALTATALAANPKKGGTYTGKTSGGVQLRRIVLVVSKDGKSAVAKLACSQQHAGTIRKLAIHKGMFSGKQTTGSVVEWTISGSFTSSTTAKVKIYLHTLCSGGVTHLTLTLQ